MKKILVLMTAAMLLFSCNKDDKGVAAGVYEFDGMITTRADDTDYNTEDVAVKVDYDKDAGTASVLLRHVKFVPWMPVTLDLLLQDVRATANGTVVSLSGRDILPVEYPSMVEADDYLVTSFSGSLTEQSLELSLSFDDYTVKYTGGPAL
ncbi:MAG: hypothetical protein J6S66_04445 [Bacteroidales bacterium]|nr:hypothetical protein [Bacteroidales bacterium]